MSASNPAGPLARWTAPECPFRVEYFASVLDDIRLAVVDAFFSLPRGGAEIGGLLLGRRQGAGIVITGWQPLACEHAFGPSFQLSETDRKRLGDMIAAAQRGPGTQVVGWYHSHTRSEIFLSDADQEIHQHFFPEPWQVAMVVRPHTFNPTRAGFFFRGPGGTMRADASYLEFIVEPMPASQMPWREPVGAAEPPEPPAAVLSASAGPVIDVAGIVEEKPLVVAEPSPSPAVELPPPSFLTTPAPPRSRVWIALAGVLLGVAAGTGAYATRQSWFPWVTSWTQQASPVSDAPVGLHALDHDGQLEIRWDGNAPSLRTGRAGILLITDGSLARSLPLDSAHLRTGSLTYVRQSDRVDVTLTLDQPNGQKLIQAATFLGKAPAPAPPPPAKEAPVKADPGPEQKALLEENKALKGRVAAQGARIVELEKALAIEKRLVELRSRMQNQAVGGGR